MKCPNCNVNLVMTNRSNVEIDYCPDCRGIWLDRGELDKILDRSSKTTSNTQSNKGHQQEQNYPDNKYSSDKGKKRESFFGGLFDF